MIIYADELFFKNFIMSYLILVIVGEILKITYRKRNLILASISVSLLTLIAFIYEIENNFFIRSITLILIVAIGFKEKEYKKFIVEITFILLITFLIGGIMNSNINNFFEIIGCGILSIMALKKYNEYYKNRKWKIRNQYNLKFKIEKNYIELKAFLDTGNFLATNFAEEPVIIISREVLKNKISSEIFDLLLKGEIGDLNFNILKNIRPINYFVINEKMKTTYGLKVKNIKIQNENCEIIRDAVIILSQNKIKESEAIIGINLLEGGMESGDNVNFKTKSTEIIC